MKRPSLLLLTGALLATLPLPALARIKRTTAQTFAVEPGGSLTVSTEGGDVRVTLGTTDEVRVESHFVFPKADTEAEADEAMKELEFSVTQSGNDVAALARSERSHSLFSWKTRPVSVSFTVTVPARYHADLKTSGGDIDVLALGGNLLARTSGGDITLGRVAGEVEATTSGGDVTLKEGTGTARLTTSGGDIRVERTAGAARLTTSGGDIFVGHAGASVQAATSGGDIQARFAGSIPADSNLSSSGGDIVAQVGPEAAFRLEAGTSGGSVEVSDLPLRLESGGLGKNRVQGVVNEGGSLLKLRTSGGDIHVKGS